MIVYNISHQEQAYLLSPDEKSGKRMYSRKPESFQFYSCQSMKDVWDDEVTMELEENTKDLPDNWDALFSSSRILTFSESGFDKYNRLLTSYGEFLPATFEGETVHVFHCMNWINCFDRDQTLYEVGYTQGPVTNYRRIKFIPEMLAPDIMFLNLKTRGSRLWFTSSNESNDLLRMFLDNQTGFKIQPVDILAQS